MTRTIRITRPIMRGAGEEGQTPRPRPSTKRAMRRARGRSRRNSRRVGRG